MNREQLEDLSRKELIAMLPDGHGFHPVASKKADIIDAVLALPGDGAVIDVEGTLTPVKANSFMGIMDRMIRNEPVTSYGIVIRQEPDVYIRFTPVGGGRWRCESTAWPEDEIVEGGVDVFHNGQWLVLDGLGTDNRGHLRWDGTPLPPRIVDPKELE